MWNGRDVVTHLDHEGKLGSLGPIVALRVLLP